MKDYFDDIDEDKKGYITIDGKIKINNHIRLC